MRSGPILAVLVHFFSRLPLNFVSPCPPDCYYKAKQKLSLISGYESRGGSSAFWLPTSNFRLPTCDFQLQTSDLRLHRSNFRLQTWQSANSVFLISDFRLPISHYWFPASDFWLDSSVLFGSIAVRSTTRVLMLKVKAQWKGRLYRSRHKREQVNLLLKKQLSTKPTRQPMRFSWRTKTMVLPDHKVAVTTQSKH